MNFLTTFLATSNFDRIGQILKDFLNSWWSPILIVIGACGGILGLVTGVRIWSASASGDENKLKSAKQFLLYVVIGIIVIFVLATLVPILVAAFGDFYDANS